MTSPASVSAPTKNEYLVFIPDHPNVLSTRIATRPLHIQSVMPLVKNGTLLFGGAFFDADSEPTPETLEGKAEKEEEIPRESKIPTSESNEDKPAVQTTPHFKGTVLLATVGSKEEILEILKKDPYTQHGVWDLEGVKIWGFKTAVRMAL